MGQAAALRQAQLDVRAKYPNPYYWAGFVLSGDGGTVGDVNPKLASSGSEPPVLAWVGGTLVILLALGAGWWIWRRKQ